MPRVRLQRPGGKALGSFLLRDPPSADTPRAQHVVRVVPPQVSQMLCEPHLNTPTRGSLVKLRGRQGAGDPHGRPRRRASCATTPARSRSATTRHPARRADR